jgi:hypothetical protein
MIGLVKQNIEFTLKTKSFYIVRNLSSGSDRTLKSRQIPAQQSLDNHAANDCLEPTLPNAAQRSNDRITIDCGHLFTPDRNSRCFTVRLILRLGNISPFVLQWCSNCSRDGLHVLAASEVEFGPGSDA